MPVTFDNAIANGDPASRASASFVMTLTTNASLVVGIVSSDPTASVSAVAYGGVALTQIGVTRSLSIWALSAPASGANTLSCNFGLTTWWAVIAASYVGVQAANGFGTISSLNTATVPTLNMSVSSTINDMAVVWTRVNTNNTVVFNNGNTRASCTASANLRFVMADITGASGSVTLSATVSTADTSWNAIGVSLRFSAAAAASGLKFTRTLMRVGY